MVSLDINTPRGQESLRQEHDAVALWQGFNPGWAYAPTDKDSPCPVDGILINGNGIAALVETKCRIIEESVFFEDFAGEWLVTFSKLEKAKQLAHGLCLPLVGFLYLVPSQVLLVRKLAEDGEFVVPMRIANTNTQATINGGVANRCNAYIDMTGTKTKRYEKSVDLTLDQKSRAG
jgi:hypothetical protein